MLSPQNKQAVLIGAFALLAVIALAGWTRDSRVAAGGPSYLTPQGVHTTQQLPYGGPEYTARHTYGNLPPGAQPAYATAYTPAAVAENCAEPQSVVGPAYVQPVSTRYRTYERPRVVRQVVYEDPEPRRVVERRKKRSTGKSAAIVAGSAGVGAAVGALAGGGKGAGIGALTGGAAGFIYDRLTHNR